VPQPPYFNPVMKKILQSVALALAALLAVQPALASMTCAHKVCADGTSSPDCCLPANNAPMQGMAMAMPGMGVSGQAPSQLLPLQSNCDSEPCCTVSGRLTTLPATSVKSPVNGVVAFTRLGQPVATALPIQAAITPADAAVPPPDRHVLFHVFRI